MGRNDTVWKLLGGKPWAPLGAGCLVVAGAACNVAEVVVLEEFVDGFQDFSRLRILLFAVLLAGFYGFRYFQTPLLERLNHLVGLQLRAALDRKVAEKAARISAAALEEEENQALLGRLQNEPERRYAGGFFAVLQILGGAVGTVGVFALILEHVPVYLLIVVLLLGLMAVVFRLIGRYKVTMYHSRQEIARRGDYLSGILFDRSLAQEKKLFGYTGYIQKLYREETIASGKSMRKSILISNLILWLYDNITYLFSASAYLLFLPPLYQGEMNLGLYIAVIPALVRMGEFFVAVGSSSLPAYREYLACLEDMNRLNALPEQYYVPEKEGGKRPKNLSDQFHEIKGENLVFRYPGQEKPVIEGLNFTFQSGRNYALVGENGCGKSTFIKLLMGLYQPEKGVITVDGEDIRTMEFGRLQGLFSAVFQDFNRYDYTIRENIVLSDLGEEEEERMQSAASEAGLDAWIASCPEGYDTRLGNLEEGGVNLSGGQWQRLSIARLLYRRAGICIWDEPTAAMDPLAESRLYGTFQKKKSRNRLNLFVTHRLGAAVGADEICVMGEGRFLEQGNHEELMKKAEGVYRRMFEAQKGMYQ